MATKIMKVKIKNFKVIEDFEMQLDGKSVLLLADNGRGKSSLMSAIEIALGSKKGIPSHMNKDGEAIVEVDKDGQPYTFQWKVNKKGDIDLKVTLPNGLREDKKGVIAGIIGAIDFDINEFVSLSDSTAGRKKQVEMFKKLLPSEFIEGLNEFEKKLKNTFDERTEINNKIKTLKGFINESPIFGADLKVQPVDVEALNLELEAANKKNQLIKEKENGYEQRCQSIENRKKEIERLKLLIEEEERKVHDEETLNKLYTDWRKKNDYVDVSEMSKRLAEASEINVKASKAEDHNKKLKQLAEFEEQAGEMTALIESTRQAIADAIRDFDSPVPGLSFDDEKLIYNGIPVELASLSTSEIIELGIKMKFASNPGYGVMMVEKGESLGKERYENLLAYAKKYDLQLFIEQVIRGKEELEVQFIPEV